ncbi:MAG: YbaK/EbsC family protein [Candidatus Woesearchaeota archaeon]|nr:YbaK/EbsC family protein [Candidatus Woesearchaeota archaeon]
MFEKITDLLNKSNIEYEIIEHKPVYTSEEAAKVRGTSLDQGCKALICKTEKGFVQACVSGAKEIDLHKLKDVLNTKKIELATAEEVKELSGLSIGAVPPFGNLFQIEVYLDNSVLKNEHIAFNAALHTKSIRMKAKDLVKATQAKSADFSK